MPDEDISKRYTPRQVAEIFGTTVGALRNRRKRGQIEGIRVSENYYVYTQEQVDKANIKDDSRKRGPKPKKETNNQLEERTA